MRHTFFQWKGFLVRYCRPETSQQPLEATLFAELTTFLLPFSQKVFFGRVLLKA